MIVINMAQALRNPFVPHKNFIQVYHAVVWALAVAATVILGVSDQAGQNQLNFCWIREQSSETHHVSHYMMWGLVYIPQLVTSVLSLLILVYCLCKFQQQRHTSLHCHASCHRVIVQSGVYLVWYVAYTALSVWVNVQQYLFLDETSEPNKYFSVYMAVFIALRGPCSFIPFVWNTKLIRHMFPGRSAVRRNSCTYIEMRRVDAGLDVSLMHEWRADLMVLTAKGIHLSASETEADAKFCLDREAEVVSSDYDAVTPIQFDWNCEDVRFHHYAPLAFRAIRQLVGVHDSFLSAFDLDGVPGHILDEMLIGHGNKSAMYYYLSKDNRFIVKQAEFHELDLLVEILPTYTKFLRNNLDPTISQIL